MLCGAQDELDLVLQGFLPCCLGGRGRKEGGKLWPGLQNESKASLGKSVRSCFKIKKNSGGWV